MEYVVEVSRGDGGESLEVIYSQLFTRLDVARLVKELNGSYWADAASGEVEQEEKP